MPSPHARAVFSKPGQLDEGGIAYLDPEEPRPVAMVRIRHYNAIPAGAPQELNPDGVMWIDVVHSKVKESWYTLRVMGDSTSLPCIRELLWAISKWRVGRYWGS